MGENLPSLNPFVICEKLYEDEGYHLLSESDFERIKELTQQLSKSRFYEEPKSGKSKLVYEGSSGIVEISYDPDLLGTNFPFSSSKVRIRLKNPITLEEIVRKYREDGERGKIDFISLQIGPWSIIYNLKDGSVQIRNNSYATSYTHKKLPSMREGKKLARILRKYGIPYEAETKYVDGKRFYVVTLLPVEEVDEVVRILNKCPSCFDKITISNSWRQLDVLHGGSELKYSSKVFGKGYDDKHSFDDIQAEINFLQKLTGIDLSVSNAEVCYECDNKFKTAMITLTRFALLVAVAHLMIYPEHITGNDFLDKFLIPATTALVLVYYDLPDKVLNTLYTWKSKKKENNESVRKLWEKVKKNEGEDSFVFV